MPRFLSGLRSADRTPLQVGGQPVLGLGQRVAAEPERKDIFTLPGYELAMAGSRSVTGMPGRPWVVQRVVRDAYGRVVWVYKPVDVLATNQARLPIGWRERKGHGFIGPEAADEDPWLYLLNEQANPVESAYHFRKRLSQQVLMSNRGSFVAVTYSRGKTPLRVNLLPPDRTKIIPTSDGGIERFDVLPHAASNSARATPYDPDVVRWIREPHPLDTYAGMTPWEAAGLSVEGDHFARLWNRQSMANSREPGTVVGVSDPDDDLSDEEMDRIERRLGGGPMDAGATVVISGDLTFAKTGSTSKDMDWKSAREASREELLVSSGTPESQLGYASGSTFANAGVEATAYWKITVKPHCESVARGFRGDAPKGYICEHDYTGVEALEADKRAERAEMRDEHAAGLITSDYYAEKTGRPVMDVPGSRSRWITGGVPIAPTPEDQEAAEKLAPVGSATQAAPMRAGAAGQPNGTASANGHLAAYQARMNGAGAPGTTPATAVGAGVKDHPQSLDAWLATGDGHAADVLTS